MQSSAAGPSARMQDHFLRPAHTHDHHLANTSDLSDWGEEGQDRLVIQMPWLEDFVKLSWASSRSVLSLVSRGREEIHTRSIALRSRFGRRVRVDG